jgi:hypothetical protein
MKFGAMKGFSVLKQEYDGATYTHTHVYVYKSHKSGSLKLLQLSLAYTAICALLYKGEVGETAVLRPAIVSFFLSS